MSAALTTAHTAENVLEVLDYHQHTDGVPCAMVLLQIDGNDPFECCIPVDELHVENTPEPTATDVVLEAQRTGEPVADVLARATK